MRGCRCSLSAQHAPIFPLKAAPETSSSSPKDASRAAVIDELLTMLGIEAAGEEVTDGVISGRYEGELSRVLHQLAPDNGFVIGHAGGQPRRVVFSGHTSTFNVPGDGARPGATSRRDAFIPVRTRASG